jgi:hypothetical protein
MSAWSAQNVKNVPGRKTDVSDRVSWINSPREQRPRRSNAAARGKTTVSRTEHQSSPCAGRKLFL